MRKTVWRIAKKPAMGTAIKDQIMLTPRREET
jgi:hypothetical protein